MTLSSISAAKFAMKLRTCFGVGCGGFFGGGEIPYGFCLAANSDAGTPSRAARHFANPLISRSVVASNLGVARILAFVRNSKIATPIVQTIPINMVNKFTVFGLQNQPMHVRDLRPVTADINTISGVCRKHFTIWAKPIVSMPKQAVDKLQICGVNYCLPASIERNISDIAFNADWAYVLLHLARLHLAGVGRLRVQPPGPSFMAYNRGGCNA